MSTSRAPVDLVIMAGWHSSVLWSSAVQLRRKLEGIPGLSDVVPAWWPDEEEVRVEVDSHVARVYGTTPANVARWIRTAVGGMPVSGLRLRGFLDVPIRVAYEDRWVDSPMKLEGLPIPTALGPVPLRTLALVREETTQTLITRVDLAHTLDITAFNVGRPLSHVLARIKNVVASTPLPGDVKVKMSGTAADMQESMERVMRALMLGVALLVALLIGTFRSFILPFPLLVAIPLAVIGSMWGLLIFAKPMCMPAMMGMVLLAGVVINNSIFLIDFIGQGRAQRMEREQAVEEAVRVRLRPVLMTTVSTFVGMLPMILETAVGLERMSPLATAAGFGLVVGTVMTLVITPGMYSLLDDAAQRVKQSWG